MVAGVRKVVVDVPGLLMRPVLRLLGRILQPATLGMQTGTCRLFMVLES